MKIGELQQLFGISDTTIRTYIKNYDEFFSSRHGKQRVYTEKDIKVLATILDAERNGFDKDAIAARLRDEDFADAPSLGEAMDTRLVPFSTVEQMAHTAEIKVELEKIRGEKNLLELQLSEEKLKVQGGLEKIIELQNKLQENTDKIADLRESLARAETKIEMRENLEHDLTEARQAIREAEKTIQELRYQLGKAERKGWFGN